MTSAISAGIATEVTDANINDFGYNLKGDHNIGEGRPYRFGLGGGGSVWCRRNTGIFTVRLRCGRSLRRREKTQPWLIPLWFA